MNAGGLKNVAKRLQHIDAVFAASLYFGLDRNNHTLSLGLLICWIGIHCSQQIWKTRKDINWAQKTTPSLLILGLTAFHARSIIQLDDNPGGAIYILIAASIFTGSLYSLYQRKTLLRWISGAALAINLKILQEGSSANLNLLDKAWMVDINNNVHAMGFGRISSLASMIAFFTIIGLYGLRGDNNTAAKALHIGSLTTGYFLCWQSNSEMALGAPLLAAIASFLICRKDYLPRAASKRKISIITGATILVIMLAIWEISFKEKFLYYASKGHFLSVIEPWRLEQWKCWLSNSIFAGNNKIVHGIGFNIKEISQLCNNNNPDGGLAQFISQHGLLGGLALLLLLGLITKSILQLRKLEINSSLRSELLRCRWSEVALGSTMTVLLCNFITPSYSASYLNASLTGLICSLGICTASLKGLKT